MPSVLADPILDLSMSLPELTALMSKVGKANPSLVSDRNVILFIQACIDEAKKLPVERPPFAPCDADEH